MVAHDDEDDLFKHTSMTFGEHLEELRRALFKAVIALAIGFAIGLIFGKWIVGTIQYPLQTALERYYQKEAMESVNAQLPAELQDDPAVERLIYEDKLLPETRYFSPAEMLAELKKQYPELGQIELRAAATGEKPDAQPAESGANADKSHDQQSVAKDADAAEAKKKLAAERRKFAKADMIRLFVWRPMNDDERLSLDAIGVPEPFVIYLKASFLAGAILSSPFVFYYMWQFVAAGLYPHEKRYIHVFLPFSVGLFLLGAVGAFLFVFPPVLGYFFAIADWLGVQMRPRLSEWLSFVLLLPLGFGIAFQLPLVMLFLERINVLSVQIFLSKWRIAVLLMAIAAMVLSPGGDPYSMMMMLIPLIGLYFGGIALCKWLPPPRSRTTPKPKKEELAGVD